MWSGVKTFVTDIFGIIKIITLIIDLPAEKVLKVTKFAFRTVRVGVERATWINAKGRINALIILEKVSWSACCTFSRCLIVTVT